ncbi:dihydrofolate reductase, partial [Thermoproteota archaeon]
MGLFTIRDYKVSLDKSAEYSNNKLALPTSVILAKSFEYALTFLDTQKSIESVFVIGGSNVYHHTITHPLCETLILTRIHKDYLCDSFFPKYGPVFTNFLLADEI